MIFLNIAYFKNSEKYFGYDAIEMALKETTDDLFGNFKLEIGKHYDNNALKNAKLNGTNVSVGEVFNGFVGSISKKLKMSLEGNNELEAHILIAEPIPMHDLKNWSSNYRKWLKRHFESLKHFYSEDPKDFKNIFISIDFMPEPFAIFQYYKSVIKTFVLDKKRTLNVMVVDIGGGTTDTCIIQTNKDGELAKGSKNSVVHGANSVYAGGFKINELILMKAYKKAKLGNFSEIKRIYEKL